MLVAFPAQAAERCKHGVFSAIVCDRLVSLKYILIILVVLLFFELVLEMISMLAVIVEGDDLKMQDGSGVFPEESERT